MEILSLNLFALRKRRGLSREAVARALEISAMTYQRYEKNLRDPLMGREPLPEPFEKGD